MKTLIKHTVVLALLLAAPGLAAAQPITITVKGVSFKMVKVQGGTFTMGATPESRAVTFTTTRSLLTALP